MKHIVLISNHIMKLASYKHKELTIYIIGNNLHFIKFIIMKKIASILLILFINFSFLNCSNDNSPAPLLNVEGLVLGTVSCNTENNGRAISVKLSNPLDSDIEMIIIPNLPSEFKDIGNVLQFNIEQSQEGFTNCVAIFSSDIMFNVSNVKLISKNGTP